MTREDVTHAAASAAVDPVIRALLAGFAVVNVGAVGPAIYQAIVAVVMATIPEDAPLVAHVERIETVDERPL